jgi:hypothetical protein
MTQVHQIPTQGHDITLTFKVSVDRPMVLRIKGYDAHPFHNNSVYFDREFGTADQLFQGTKMIQAPMPVSPEKMNLVAFDSLTGSQSGVRILEVKAAPLDKRIVAFNTPDDYEYYRFLESFIKACGYRQTGMYKSENGKFKILLSGALYNEKGQPLSTPARIFRPSGIQEWNKPKTDKMTIPIRAFIGLHEFCHFRVNTRNEFEADHYALRIYLGMGFPKSEAMYAFTKIFNPVDENHEKHLESRMQEMSTFIKNF